MNLNTKIQIKNKIFLLIARLNLNLDDVDPEHICPSGHRVKQSEAEFEDDWHCPPSVNIKNPTGLFMHSSAPKLADVPAKHFIGLEVPVNGHVCPGEHFEQHDDMEHCEAFVAV